MFEVGNSEAEGGDQKGEVTPYVDRKRIIFTYS
jgi:hypothetical protein